MILMELDEEKWKKLRDDYDQVDRSRRKRSSGSSMTMMSDETKEWSSLNPKTKEHKNKMYQLTIVDTLDWSFEGVTRLNYKTSNENIADIVLRNHAREFEWKKIPFKPKSYIYNEVWRKMCDKAKEWKNKIKDEWELFDRYDDVLS